MMDDSPEKNSNIQPISFMSLDNIEVGGLNKK